MTIDLDRLLRDYADASHVPLADPAVVRHRGERRTRRQVVGSLAGLTLAATALTFGAGSWDRADQEPVGPIPTPTPAPTPTPGTEAAGQASYPIASGSDRISAAAIAVRRGRFVVVGDNSTWDEPGPSVYWSDDAVHWQGARGDALVGATNVTDVIADESGFLAVGLGGDEPAAWYSTDGKSWERAEVESEPGGPVDNLWGVTSTDLGYFAWGHDSGQAVLLRSDDGRRWTYAGDQRAFDLSGDESICAVADSADGLTVTGALPSRQLPGRRQVTWTSPDGDSWTASPAGNVSRSLCEPPRSDRHWQASWPGIGEVSIYPYGEGDAVIVAQPDD